MDLDLAEIPDSPNGPSAGEDILYFSVPPSQMVGAAAARQEIYYPPNTPGSLARFQIGGSFLSSAAPSPVAGAPFSATGAMQISQGSPVTGAPQAGQGFPAAGALQIPQGSLFAPTPATGALQAGQGSLFAPTPVASGGSGFLPVSPVPLSQSLTLASLGSPQGMFSPSSVFQPPKTPTGPEFRPLSTQFSQSPAAREAQVAQQVFAAENTAPNYGNLTSGEINRQTSRLQSHLSTFGNLRRQTQYGDAVVAWFDEVTGGAASSVSRRSRALLNAGAHLYPGAFITSRFLWQSFSGGEVVVTLSDWEIRSFLRPHLEALRQGRGEDFSITFNAGSRQEVTLEYNAQQKQFAFDYVDAGYNQFYGQGNVAVFDWLGHLANYFR